MQNQDVISLLNYQIQHPDEEPLVAYNRWAMSCSHILSFADVKEALHILSRSHKQEEVDMLTKSFSVNNPSLK